MIIGLKRPIYFDRKEWRENKIKQGLCGHCGKNSLKSKSLCSDCLFDKKLKRVYK